MNKSLKWRKSEGGVVGRFGDPRRALKSFALVLSDGEVNPLKQSFIVDPGLKIKQLQPRLISVLDHAQISRFPESAVNSLGVCIVLRDPAIKRFSLVGDWPIGNLPESIALDDLPEFERIVQDRMVISVGLTVIKDGGEFELGTTLARKEFIIHTEVNGNQFPHQFVESTYFEKEGLPKSTSWFVHMLNEDGDRPADETFVVYINKELAEVASSKSADAIWASLATDVFTVLFERLLRGEIPEKPSSGTILEQIERQLASHGHNLHTVASWVQSGETSKLMALAQAITKVNILLRGAL